MYSIVDYGDMIADKVRMDPYIYALKAAVQPDSVVLDVGTGTGIHALLACKFGAQKVYAIEPNEAIHLAKEMARVNGFADRIEFIQDVSTRVTLPVRADVVVSDLRGVLPYYGGHLPSIIDARQRHLANGGQLIPKRDTLWVAFVETSHVYNELTNPWDYPYGVAMDAAKQSVLNSFCEEDTGSFRSRNFLTEPQILTEIDYGSVENPNLARSEVTQPATRAGTAHGLLLWFDAEIGDEIHITNDPRSSRVAEVYGCAFFPLLEPVPVEKGDEIVIGIEANLIDDYYIWRWNTLIRTPGEPRLTKVEFEQSTELDGSRAHKFLDETSLKRRPQRSDVGDVDHFVLGMMDGKLTIEQIAREVQEAYPRRFNTGREAQIYVRVLAQDYGH